MGRATTEPTPGSSTLDASIPPNGPRDGAVVEGSGRLAAEWKGLAAFLASPTAVAELPAYRAIIGMGRAVVPQILDELRREPDHWFVALKRITGEDPVPADARGGLDRMAEAWLDWGRSHDLAD